MPSWAAPRTFGYTILGIAVCSVSTTPIFFLIDFIRELMKGRSLHMVLEGYMDIELTKFLSGCLVLTLGILPVLIIVALVMHLLGRREHDTCGRAILAGAVTSFIAIVVMASLFLGGAPGWNSEDVADLPWILLVSAALSTLYWMIAVRPQRRRRALWRQHYASVRAME
jgi:hypothetical protein